LLPGLELADVAAEFSAARGKLRGGVGRYKRAGVKE
jgi:hypothetical protein